MGRTRRIGEKGSFGIGIECSSALQLETSIRGSMGEAEGETTGVE